MLLYTALLAHFLHNAYAFSIPQVVHFPKFADASRAIAQQQPLQDSLDAWIVGEERIALDNLLANVAPGGRNVAGKGVADGTVIASPSKEGPDYWYQCTDPCILKGGAN